MAGPTAKVEYAWCHLLLKVWQYFYYTTGLLQILMTLSPPDPSRPWRMLQEWRWITQVQLQQSSFQQGFPKGTIESKPLTTPVGGLLKLRGPPLLIVCHPARLCWNYSLFVQLPPSNSERSVALLCPEAVLAPRKVCRQSLTLTFRVPELNYSWFLI